MISPSVIFSKYGIDMSKRPDVVKGAVYSYSIQHGQLSAANAVVAAKISNSTSDSEFLRPPILLPYETVSGLRQPLPFRVYTGAEPFEKSSINKEPSGFFRKAFFRPSLKYPGGFMV